MLGDFAGLPFNVNPRKTDTQRSVHFFQHGKTMHSSCRLCLFLSPGARPELNTDIVVGETDYTSYAILFYQKQGKITVKLYSRFNNCVSPNGSWCHNANVMLVNVFMMPCRQVRGHPIRAHVGQVWTTCWKTQFGAGLPFPLPYLQYVHINSIKSSHNDPFKTVTRLTVSQHKAETEHSSSTFVFIINPS